MDNKAGNVDSKHMITTTESIGLDPVLEIFRDYLKKTLGPKLKELWLFGSRARGDCSEDSDYDVLVISEGSRPENRKLVALGEDEILRDLNKLVVSVVYTPDLWIQGRNSPLGVNILKQGIRFC
jgi:predicted nucleotidyltransferase